jgi:hypothetical protein
MRAKLLLFASLLSLFCGTSKLQAQELLISDSIRLSLLTCSPGDALYSTFGHSALRVVDYKTGQDFVFNWGIFNFNTPNFYWKFMRGKLPYSIGVDPFQYFYLDYKSLGRGVVEAPLNLPREAQDKIMAALRENYKFENREYKYDFFFDNCATRIRDILAKALPLEYSTQDTSRTIKPLRSLLDEHLGAMPWSDFGIDLVLGLPADQKASLDMEMFLPDYLGKNLPKARYQGQPIFGANQVILNVLPKAQQSGGFPKPLVFFSILAAVILGLGFVPSKWLNRLVDGLLFLALGMAGSLICFLRFGTDHLATKGNLNLIWANPLALLCLGSLASQRKRWLWITGGLAVLTLLFFPFSPQDFHPAILPILLMIAGRCALRIFGKTN